MKIVILLETGLGGLGRLYDVTGLENSLHIMSVGHSGFAVDIENEKLG